MVSLYLASSLEGASVKRRLASWSFFYLSLLLYVAIVLEVGVAAFVIGISEILVVLLSSLGLVLCIWSNFRGHA